MKPAIYSTREEQFARRYGVAGPYFRLQDSLCKTFLELATDPREFEGLKLLFPFIREMSVLRFPRTAQGLATWTHLAFIAGHDLGRGRPESLDEVLPGLERPEAVRRLRVMQHCSGEDHLTFEGLRKACASIVRAQWSEVAPEQLETIIIEAVTKTLRTGYASGTVAQVDPALCEFVWDIPTRISAGIVDIATRCLVSAPLNSVGKSVLQLLEHPLLRVVVENYPKALERDVALAFFREQLRVQRVRSEDHCPASELDLTDWVAAGLHFGSSFEREHPKAVREILRECENSELAGTRSMVREIVASAGDAKPWSLVQALKKWQQNVFGWNVPSFYGDELARVVYYSDFAIWIPWVQSTPAKESTSGTASTSAAL